MNIFIVTYEFEKEGGGLSYSCRCFRDLLAELGHKVCILSSSINADTYIQGGYDLSLNRSLAYEQKLKRDTMSTPSGSLIIAFGGGFNSYYASLLAKLSNARLWLMLRGSDANISKWDCEKSYYLTVSLQEASLVIGLSKEICMNAKLLVPNIRCVVIPNICDRQKSKVKEIKSNNIVIGTGATHLNEKKGVLSLIEMVNILSLSHPETSITLELVGEIDSDILEQYKSQCETMGVLDKVIFIGRKSREEFRKIQISWDFYVQASVCEGMGNSVTDSMSLGVPIILSNTGYIAEKASILFPELISPTNSGMDLANTFDRIISEPNHVNKYQRFYDDFFHYVKKDTIINLWSNLIKVDEFSQKENLPSGILSVVLHEVSGEIHDSITTPIHVFNKFVEDLYIIGYKLCSMRDYLDMDERNRKNSIVCTFDDGYKGVIECALPIMKRYGFTATVYVCTEYIGKYNDWNFKDKVRRAHLNYGDLSKLIEEGWEVGSHGITHRSLLRLSDEDMKIELSESKKELEKRFGKIDSYAYPYGDCSEYIMKTVKNYYTNAVSLTQGGVHLSVDSHRIRRYYVSEIYQIIQKK